MRILGKFYPAGSAAQYKAALHCDAEVFSLEVDGQVLDTGQLDSVAVAERLGNVERKITLPDGSVFSTPDNDAVDAAFKKHNPITRIIHAIESHMGWVLVSIVGVVIFSGGFFKWGIPWMSAKIAHALPEKTNEIIAGHTFDFLDKYMFEESELDPERAEQIRQHFHSKLIPLEARSAEIDYKLHFRDWSAFGISIPNALALPSGDLIMTDKFVELSESQDEIDSVLLHEMGHVANRHSLEMVIESTIFATAIMMIAGDSNGLADLGVGLGSMMVSSSYSRGHETEADQYAFEHMLEAGIDPQAFSDIIARITMHMEEEEGGSEEGTSEDEDNSDYLSSHPSTAARIRMAKKYSECFREGLKVCVE